jgi:hypothetical protein
MFMQKGERDSGSFTCTRWSFEDGLITTRKSDLQIRQD